MKESVKDYSHDLKNTTITNKILSKFFKNTHKKKKPKFFKKVKRNLIGTMPTFTTFDVD
jgi:hypothetical protein